MQSLPIALELVSVNLLKSEIEFKVYDLDEKMQHVRGNLRDFLEYVQDAQDFREFRFLHSRLVAEHEQLTDQFRVCQKQIQRKQEYREKPKTPAQEKLERFKADHPIPIYNSALARTISSSTKRDRLIVTVLGTVIGLFLCVAGEGSTEKFLGGMVILGSGYGTYVTHLTETDDSQVAEEQRRLKQEAICIRAMHREAEREAHEEVNAVEVEIADLHYRCQELNQKIEEKNILVKLADLSRQVDQELGNGIIYGSEEQQQLLKMLIYQQQADERAMMKGLAGAAILGLMVVGAVTGFNL